MEDEWIKTLKAGDAVFIEDRYDIRESKVVRVTKTLIVCIGYREESEIKFDKNGSRKTDAWSWSHIRPNNEEYQQKFQKQNLLSSINSLTYDLYNRVDYKNMSFEKLLKIRESLKGVEDAIKVN